MVPLLGVPLALAGALSCAARPDPRMGALDERLRRVEERLRALEEAQRQAVLQWGGPAPESAPALALESAPSAAQQQAPPRIALAPQEEAPPAAQAQTTPAPLERAVLLGTAVLSGPYAAIGGRGVALLQPLADRPPAPRPRSARLAQRDRDFVPAVLALPVGSTVAFPNEDPIYHNVFSLSPAKRFDLGVFKQGESREVTFERPGLVQVLCYLHANMSAYVIVHEEPYAAVLDRSGRFGFRNLPPGPFRLRLWHERAGKVVQQQVQLRPGQNRVQVPVVADQAPTLPPNKEGKPRGPRRAP